jgi:hypothetical protein
MKIRSLLLGSIAAFGLSMAFAPMLSPDGPAFLTKSQRRSGSSSPGGRARRKWKRARASGRH